MATEDALAPVSHEVIKEAILEILKDSDLENTTEFKVRKLASEKLNTDLNSSSHKKLVRKVVEDYLNSKAAGAAAAEEEANEDQKEGFGEALNDDKPVENDSDEDDEKHRSRFAPPPEQRKKQTSVGGDNDDQVVCQLSNKRNVSIQKFRGKTLISIREYYEKDGELRPSAKGISLSVDQWDILKGKVSAIENAIAELQS